MSLFCGVVLSVISSLAIILLRKTKIIYHACEDMIEKSVLWITVCHHEACGVMTNRDPPEWIFLSYYHTNNGLFFLHTQHDYTISDVKYP